jgi:hypothetical protein
MAEEKSPNPEAEVAEVTSPSPNPQAGESGTPAASIENAPSSDEPQASDFPTANAPDPKAANPEVNANATADKPTEEASLAQKGAQAIDKENKTETEPAPKDPADKPAKTPAAKAADGKPDAKAAKAKKEKAPAVEDKPFTEFIEQDYLPALRTALAKQGADDVDLAFTKDKIKAVAFNQTEESWQVVGSWQDGKRRFNIYFPSEDINKPKIFSCSANGANASTLESFMIDERKVTLDLLVLYTIQRLNAQKWLARN